MADHHHQKERIVMIPFMAQGHIIPFLSLALHLEKTRNYTIIFVNTPLNIKKLKHENPNSSIQFIEIPFNASDFGLPPNTENTDSLRYNLVLTFLQFSMALRPSFRNLVSDLAGDPNSKTPVSIITDMFFSWCAEIAHEFGIFHAVYCNGGGFGFACFYSLCG
ncbi:UDP-Glycosyltransferase superfamily protein [Euphorbia peplus]|nr:UDP-Glycosyltransferase superfamily protein [Euphorbia peplus]